MSTQQSIPFKPVTDEDTPEESKKILQEAKEKLGFVPNMYKFMAKNPSLLDSYYHAYDAFRELAGFTPAEQEVLFLSISFENECHYCMAAHSFLGDKVSNVPEKVLEALRNGEAVPDTKLAALSTFCRKMVQNRGNVSDEDITALLDAGYEKKHVFGVITAIGVKTFSNYMNHITETPVDDMFSEYSWSK